VKISLEQSRQGLSIFKRSGCKGVAASFLIHIQMGRQEIRIMKSDTEIIEELKQLTAGLLWMSESDYPFETVLWEGLPEISPQFLRSLSGEAEDAPVEIVSVDEFFRVAMSEESWRTEESRQEAKKYRRLVQTLKDNLDELKVYRVGKINIPVYIVGRDKLGNWLGISSRVVET
jgi:Nuclease A inhibitor-like protein